MFLIKLLAGIRKVVSINSIVFRYSVVIVSALSLKHFHHGYKNTKTSKERQKQNYEKPLSNRKMFLGGQGYLNNQQV